MATVRKKRPVRETTALKESVHISAALVRPKNPTPGEYYAYAAKLYIDTKDECEGLWADAGCGDECFVCKVNEIPALIAFLQKIADGSKATK